MSFDLATFSPFSGSPLPLYVPGSGMLLLLLFWELLLVFDEVPFSEIFVLDKNSNLYFPFSLFIFSFSFLTTESGFVEKRPAPNFFTSFSAPEVFTFLM